MLGPWAEEIEEKRKRGNWNQQMRRALCLIDEPNKVGFKDSPQVYCVNN